MNPEIPLVDTQVDVQEDLLVIQRLSDVEPILEDAKKRHNEGLHTTGLGDKHAARFDPVIVEKYCNDHGITFQEWCQNDEHIRAMLNDPTLAHFRVWKGRV